MKELIVNGGLKNLINSGKITMKEHGPEILMGIGIGSMLSGAIIAVKKTPKATILLNSKIRELGDGNDIDEAFKNETYINYLKYLTPKEIFETTWRVYTPSVSMMIFGAACVISSNTILNKRNAAITTAYTLTDAAYKTYREKNIEVNGNNKDTKVIDEISKDVLANNEVGSKEIIITDKGYTLCYDTVSGRYFESSIEAIKKAVNEVNSMMINNGYISLNDFYYELGLDGTQMGYQLGWNLDKGLVDVDFSSSIATDGRPCLVIQYMAIPRYDYFG